MSNLQEKSKPIASCNFRLWFPVLIINVIYWFIVDGSWSDFFNDEFMFISEVWMLVFIYDILSKTGIEYDDNKFRFRQGLYSSKFSPWQDMSKLRIGEKSRSSYMLMVDSGDPEQDQVIKITKCFVDKEEYEALARALKDNESELAAFINP